MKKLLYFIFCLFLWLFTSCTKTPREEIISEGFKKIKTNLIGVYGQYAAEPYVEVEYLVADTDGKNKLVRELLSPPFVLGDNPVYARFDSLVVSTWRRNKYLYSTTDYKRDLSPSGAEYFRIINRSTDKTLEYFIIGTQDIVIDGETNCSTQKKEDRVFVLPKVWYGTSPIYYLLYPEKKPNRNLYHFDCSLFRFEGNAVGDLNVTTPWSVEQVVKLFRAEYRGVADTLLYLDENGYSSRPKARMIESIRYGKGLAEYKNRNFYGVIGPGAIFTNNKHTWMINTPNYFVGEPYWLPNYYDD